MALLGAYYYLWYDKDQWDRWKSVHRPRLGPYDSSRPEIISQHINWARNYGIKFFVVGWPGPGSRPDRNLKDAYLLNPLSHEMQFALLYESEARLKDNPNDTMDLDNPSKLDRLIGDLSYAATQYFDDRRYLKLEGRPVVLLYLSRIFKGNLEAAFAKLRTALARYNLFIVGDEVYWGKIRRDPMMRPKLSDADIRRIRTYDGVTAYNMHTSKREVLDSFEKKLAREYSDWAEALSRIQVEFIPSVIPGFDDTKIPERKNIPLNRSVDRFDSQLEAATKTTTKHRLVVVTSFNEWHEDTQIEPALDYGPQESDQVTYLDRLRRYS